MSSKKHMLQAAAGNMGETTWDIENAVFVQSTSSQDTGPQGLFFKDDGTKMYISGNATDSILEFNLGTAWDISTKVYVQSFSTSSEETSPEQVWFRPNGDRMYIIGTAGDDINEYSLSTAWDVSTASYVQSASVLSNSITANGFYMRSDGLKLYVCDATNEDIDEYSLGAAWNIGTLSYDQSFSIASEETAVTGVFFKPDGTRMFINGTINDQVHQYELSTAWDVSTASHSKSFSINAQDGGSQDIFFKPDGTKMYISGTVNDNIYEYDL